MIIAKQNPVELDVVVARIQKVIHNAFDVKWSTNPPGPTKKDGIICYPRCYQVIRKGHKYIEYFDSAESNSYNKDYQDIIDSEQNRMVILNDDYEIVNETDNGNFKSTYLDVIFIVDLSTTHPTVLHRADEEVRAEVVKELEKIPNVTVYKSVRKLNKIFGDIKYDPIIDLHPSHCFKVVLHVDRFSKREKIC
jgi:hypothetical protein